MEINLNTFFTYPIYASNLNMVHFIHINQSIDRQAQVCRDLAYYLELN